MADLAGTFTLLQLADSFFPSGAASFSWGLETLRAEAIVQRARDVEALVEGQLRYRWRTFDRPVVSAAFRAAGDPVALAAIDREADAATLAREAREGGRRIGAALLKVHAGIGTPGCAEYHERLRAEDLPGQMAVVHGLVGHGSGLSEGDTCALSAYGLAVGMVGAALRVGLVGHIDAQRILARQRRHVADLAAGPEVPLSEIRAYTPMAEIAMMRHETGSGRLFAN